MSGTGAVVVCGGEAFGYYVDANAPGGGRVRVSFDDADRLDLIAGRRMVIRVPGRGEADVLVVGVAPEPPFAWLTLVPVTTSAATRAG